MNTKCATFLHPGYISNTNIFTQLYLLFRFILFYSIPENRYRGFSHIHDPEVRHLLVSARRFGDDSLPSLQMFTRDRQFCQDGKWWVVSFGNPAIRWGPYSSCSRSFIADCKRCSMAIQYRISYFDEWGINHSHSPGASIWLSAWCSTLTIFILETFILPFISIKITAGYMLTVIGKYQKVVDGYFFGYLLQRKKYPIRFGGQILAMLSTGATWVAEFF